MIEPNDFDVTIVGGGPAGMLLSVLLARAGVRSLVLEKHPDFSREYRGEVLMPRFSRLMRQLGLEHVFDGEPQRRLDALAMHWGEKKLIGISFDDVAPEFPFALWMPQPVMLAAFEKEAARHPAHSLWFDASVRDLIREGDRVTGVVVDRGGESVRLTSRIVVGADGRFSSLRRLGKFEVEYTRHDFDVLWFTIPEGDRSTAAFRAFLTPARPYLVLPKLPAALQCGMLLPPNGYKEYRERGLEALKADLLQGPSIIHEFARGVHDFSQFTLLRANLDLVKDWERDGLVLIGDAAHTCSPAGAIGVSIAVETAAVAAEVIIDCVERGDFSKAALDRIQQRREPAVRAIHKLQMRLGKAIGSSAQGRMILRFLLPWLARFGLVKRALRPLAYGEAVELRS